MQIPTIDQLRAEVEDAARSIDYRSPEWAAIERYLSAKRLVLALDGLGSNTEAARVLINNKAAFIAELLHLREQNRPSSRD